MLASEVVPRVKAQLWEHGLCLQADGAPIRLKNGAKRKWPKEMWPPSPPRHQSHGLLYLVHSGGEGVQQKLSQQGSFDQSFDERMRCIVF